ncbi:MAG: SDR family oxidoreductase [Halieaceae bacterium]|jgi:NAD(P)-dependent dehydrogenase (short-subunit alcohol dehydrogenase family)|nr:SDR family oxidoreductase [Halieaceae bacterium]
MGTYALTGSASGIGAALSLALAEQGHSLITVDLKDADITADLTTVEGRSKVISEVLERAPDGLDGFVPLAGLGGGTAPDLLITRLNYFGTVALVEGLRPALAEKSGSVVLLCSNSAPMVPGDEAFIESLIAGDEEKALEIAAGISPGTHYMQTKRALNYWMRRHVMEYGREGIRMNAIAPGPTLTPMTTPLFESEEYAPIMQALLDQTPANRAADAEEISNCILFLLSPAASNVYGSLLFADGGFDAHVRQDHV